jgi:Ca-activated chloride channel homolog
MQDSPLTFASPLWLYAGPVICALVAWLLVLFDRRRASDLAKLVHPRFRSRLLPGAAPRLILTKRILWLACLLLLFISAAGPQKGFEYREVKRRGIDILFAVDTSRSMLAQDLTPNRLERARLGIHDFINRLEGDRVGLVPFAGSAYALCPLTSDYEAFRESLNALETDIIPKQGTDVASAIHEAQRLFDEQNNNHRILVLITDGEDLQGDALDAAKEAAKKGMSIYPIGVGSTTGVTIPVRLANGRTDFIRDQSGAPVTTKLDETTLRKIAETANGIYVPLGRGAEGLDTIYREKLRLVPKNEIEGRMEKIPLQRFEWPLALAILCLVMEFLLPDRIRLKKPTALPSAARRIRPAAVVPAVAVLFCFCPQPSSAQTTDARVLYNEGTAAYAAGDYQGSASNLRSALETPDLALQNRAYYNLGNALYRLGQASQAKSPEETIKAWEESMKAYADAKALDSNDRDAAFNHDLVKRKLEELKKQNPDKNRDEKDKKDQEKDEEKKDAEKKDEEKKEGEQKEGEKKDGEKKDGAQKDGEKKEGEQKKGEKKDGEPQDGEKKDGEKKEGQEGDPEKKEDKDGKEKGTKEGEAGEKKDGTKTEKEKSSTEERRHVKPMQMTKEEAQQLMNMMKGEERTVIPIPQQQQRRNFLDPNNTTKGKTW